MGVSTKIKTTVKTDSFKFDTLEEVKNGLSQFATDNISQLPSKSYVVGITLIEIEELPS